MLYALVPPLENQNSCFRWYRNPAAQRNLENKFGNSYEIYRYHRALKIPRILWNFYSDKKILLSIQLSAWLLNLQLCESWLCTFHLKSCFSDSEEGTPLPSEEGSLLYRAQLFVAWLLFSLRAWDDWHRTEKTCIPNLRHLWNALCFCTQRVGITRKIVRSVAGIPTSNDNPRDTSPLGMGNS